MCERFQIRPPGIKDAWDECDVDAKAELLAYDEIRSEEEHSVLEAQFKIMSKTQL